MTLLYILVIFCTQIVIGQPLVVVPRMAAEREWKSNMAGPTLNQCLLCCFIASEIYAC